MEVNPYAIDSTDVHKGLDFSNFGGWIREKRGDPRYSGRSGTSSLTKTTSAPVASTAFSGRSILMPQKRTYALGVSFLQEVCVAENNQHQPKVIISGREIYRSNTFLENILARIIDFNTLTNLDGILRSTKDRLRYFNTWLDSCCGIAYQAETTKLKLSLQCPELIRIHSGFAEPFLSVDYASFQGIELNSSSPNFVRDAWMTLLEGKTDVYNEYLSVLKAATGKEITPNFWVQRNTTTDELRAALVNSLSNDSSVDGGNLLYSGGRFLRRSP